MITLTDKKSLLSEFKRDQLNKSLTMFEWNGLPDTLPAVELEKQLQINGYSIIAKVDGNLYAFQGGFSGQDPYQRPTIAIVNNPALKNHDEFVIDKDCVVILNDDMKQGLRKIYEYYGQRLIENQITMLMTDYNLRMPFTISSNDDSTTQSAKEYLQKIIDGSLGVIGEQRLFKSLQVTATSGKQVSTFADLYGYQQFIMAQLNNTIGLATNNNMKRERLTTNEIEVNKNASYPLVDNMLRNRQEAAAAINKMFDTDITVQYSSIWAGNDNDDVDNDNSDNDNNDAKTNVIDKPSDSDNVDTINNDNDPENQDQDEPEKDSDPVNANDDGINDNDNNAGSDDKSANSSDEQSEEKPKPDEQNQSEDDSDNTPADDETVKKTRKDTTTDKEKSEVDDEPADDDNNSDDEDSSDQPSDDDNGSSNDDKKEKVKK